MKRTSLFIPEQTLECLASLAEKTGLPVAELIRRAVDIYLKRERNERSN